MSKKRKRIFLNAIKVFHSMNGQKIKIGNQVFDTPFQGNPKEPESGKTFLIGLQSLRAGSGAGNQTMTNVLVSSLQIPFNFYVLGSFMSCQWSDTGVATIFIGADAFIGLNSYKGYAPLATFGSPAESFQNTSLAGRVAPNEAWGKVHYPDKTLFFQAGTYAGNFSVYNPAGFPNTGAVTFLWQILIKIA